MNATELFRTQLQSVHAQVGRTLEGLGAEQINWQPKPAANSEGVRSAA